MSSTESKIFDLIEKWEAGRNNGHTPTPEELCADCPELVPELARRIQALRATAWMERPVIDATVDFVPSSRTVGRYALVSLIGQGGFGEVWKAHDPQLDRHVAIKIPKPKAIYQSESFLEEARKVGKLRHPGIVSVFDVGQSADQWFIVSELVESGSLADKIKTDRPTHEESVQLVARIAEALHYAHEQGFIHRDIKPQNILLDHDGSPKITDFGIALSETQPVAQRSRTAGTLAYMSPEQGQNQTEKIDARTDIYSLGVVLYELLTGRLPFVADDPMELWAAVVSQAPRTPRTIDRGIPVEVERLCLKALAKNPGDRFSTAHDFAAELQRAVAKPVSAVSKFSFAALLVLLIAGCGFGLWWIGKLTGVPQQVLTQVNRTTETASVDSIDRVVHALNEAKGGIHELHKQFADLPALSGDVQTKEEASAELAAELGTQALANGDMTTAFTEFNRAVDLNNGLAAAWHGRGVVLFNQGKYSEAVADLRKAISLETRKPEYFKNLAFALTKVGSHDDAVKQIIIGQSKTSLAERDQYKRFVAQVYDSRAAQRTKDGYHEGALTDLEEAVRWDDSYPDAFDDRGSIRFNLKQFEQAVSDFTRAIELAPDRHEFYVHRGHALKALKRNTEADADYVKARRLKAQ